MFSSFLIASAVATAITAQPLADEDILEPSVMNEVEHALARAPRALKFVKHDFKFEGSATERAIKLVSSQGLDGRWMDGTNDVSFAAVSELKKAAYGDGSFKVLMIGNSFSISNTHNMPQICESLGIELELCSLYIGGCSLKRHWENIVASTNATYAPYRVDWYFRGKCAADAPKALNIPAALASRRWDVVVIQQCSHESWKSESYHPFGDALVKTITSLAPQAEIMIQQTWSYTPFDHRLADWGIDQNQMFDKLEAAYGDFAKQYDFRIIPMGKAVQEWRARLPVKYTESSFGGDVCGSGVFEEKDGKVFPKGDVFHLNQHGEFLQSLVWTAKIFDVDVGGNSYRPKYISDSDDVLMKSIANGLR